MMSIAAEVEKVIKVSILEIAWFGWVWVAEGCLSRISWSERAKKRVVIYLL